MNDYEIDDFDFLNNENSFEYAKSIQSGLVLKNKNRKTKVINMMKKEHLKDVLTKVPEKNTYYHLISNGAYDYFTFLPVLIEYLGGVDEFIGSTWTMNRSNVIELFGLFDSGKIKKIDIITGLYFKRRESAVYATLIDGLIKRKQRYKSLKNHSKIILLANNKAKNYVCIEGSANFTANPRIEQYVISNDKKVFDFHKAWIEAILTDNDEMI